jgi:MFS family permease
VFSVLRFRDFRLLWLSQSASVIGDALVIVAIGLYVTRLTGNPSDVGLVLSSYAIPLVLFVLVGGVVADRLPRQTLMMVSDIARGILHGTLAILIATGTVRIWHMMAIGLLYGTAEAFFRPAYGGLVPQTVPEEDIQAAQALGGVSRELAEFASPALATALVLGVGGAAAFGLDATTFAVSAALLSRVHARQRGEEPVRSTVLTELREGWTAVRQRSWVWATLLAFSTALLVALAPFFVLGAAVAKHNYGTEAVFGLTNAAWGVGTVTGVIAGSRWRPRRPMLAGMLGAIPWSAAIALYGAGPPLWVLYPCMAAAGVGIGLFSVWWETALAQRIPPHLLSRVTAWDWMGSLALLPAGYLLAGAIAHHFGAVKVTVVGGLIGTAACAFGLLPRSTRTLERLEEATVDAEPVRPMPGVMRSILE